MTYELAWAAGLFEGEGSISSPGVSNTRLELNMTTEDTVRRFHRAVGVGTVGGPYERSVRGVPVKPQWSWSVYNLEGIQAVVAFVWAGLGERRKDQARALLRYKQTRRTGTRRPGSGRPLGLPRTESYGGDR